MKRPARVKRQKPHVDGVSKVRIVAAPLGYSERRDVPGCAAAKTKQSANAQRRMKVAGDRVGLGWL